MPLPQKIHTTFAQWLVAMAAVGALIVSIYTSTQVKEVHFLFNSRMTEFIELTQKSSKAEGVKEERERIPH